LRVTAANIILQWLILEHRHPDGSKFLKRFLLYLLIKLILIQTIFVSLQFSHTFHISVTKCPLLQLNTSGYNTLVLSTCLLKISLSYLSHDVALFRNHGLPLLPVNKTISTILHQENKHMKDV